MSIIQEKRSGNSSNLVTMKLNRTFIIPKNSVAADNVDINKIIKSDASEYGTNKKADAKFFIG